MLYWQKGTHEGEQGHFRCGRWTLAFYQEWTQFFQSCNWWTFNLVKCELERDDLTSSYHLDGACLGVGFRLRYHRKEKTAQTQEILKSVEELQTRLTWSISNRKGYYDEIGEISQDCGLY